MAFEVLEGIAPETVKVARFPGGPLEAEHRVEEGRLTIRLKEEILLAAGDALEATIA